MFGVRMSFPPLKPQSAKPRSSMSRKMMFGFAPGCVSAARAVAKNVASTIAVSLRNCVRSRCNEGNTAILPVFLRSSDFLHSL